jgi:hypothetical protein
MGRRAGLGVPRATMARSIPSCRRVATERPYPDPLVKRLLVPLGRPPSVSIRNALDLRGSFVSPHARVPLERIALPEGEIPTGAGGSELAWVVGSDGRFVATPPKLEPPPDGLMWEVGRGRGNPNWRWEGRLLWRTWEDSRPIASDAGTHCRADHPGDELLGKTRGADRAIQCLIHNWFPSAYLRDVKSEVHPSFHLAARPASYPHLRRCACICVICGHQFDVE